MGTNNNNRMGLMTKKFLIENKKTLTIFLATYLGVCIVFGIWIGMISIRSAEAFLSLYILFAGLACSIVASKTFSDINSKEGRTALLMTPARAIDKYLPRIIITVPCMIILAIIGYYVMCYSTATYNKIVDAQLFIPDMNLFTINDNEFLIIYSFFSSVLFSESLFVFGSIAWPKRSFLKTVGLFIALQMIVITIMAASDGIYVIDYGTENEVYTFLWTVSSLVLAAAIGLLYGAYIKLKRLTVI